MAAVVPIDSSLGSDTTSSPQPDLTTNRDWVTDAMHDHVALKLPGIQAVRVGSPPDIFISLRDLGIGSLPEVSNLEFKPRTVLTSQISMPVLPSANLATSSQRRSSSVHGSSIGRFSSHRFTELFGKMRHAPAENVDQVPASNQGAYDKFRTRSSRFDRQTSRGHSVRRGRGQGSIAEDPDLGDSGEDRCEDDNSDFKPSRYFNALHGPELEELRDHEVLTLPRDELWPFLLRFPIGVFGVCLGLGSQAILWRQLSLSHELHFLHIPEVINLFFWALALLALVVIFTTYTLKVLYFYEAVRREFFHPVRINFFFAPWIACMFLAIGLPPRVASSVHPAVFCVFSTPILILELKIYGQWLSGGKRRLSKVANPSTHLSIVGNFVGALLGASVGWTEVAMFFWAVGLVHYLVLFVTLYQRLPTNEMLPKDLHPVFFLFVAAPSTASVAWMKITGNFDYVSRIVFFTALFLYSSLVVRINFFRGIRFSFSCWAYTFPMTGAAIASIEYCHVATSWATQGLALLLSFIAVVTVFILFCATLLHAFVWRSLFQNDNAIAISAHKGQNCPPFTAEDILTIEHEPLHKVLLEAILARMSKDHSCSNANMNADSSMPLQKNGLAMKSDV